MKANLIDNIMDKVYGVVSWVNDNPKGSINTLFAGFLLGVAVALWVA